MYIYKFSRVSLQNKQREKCNFIVLREESRGINGSTPIELASVLVSQSVKEKFIFERTFVIGTADALGAVAELALRCTRERTIAFRS